MSKDKEGLVKPKYRKCFSPSPIAEALKEWRIGRGWTLEEVCEVFCSANINVSVNKMRAWEASQFDPTGAPEFELFSLLREWYKRLPRTT
jgi:transcriptional regulator with XRE-family HTH domain